MKLFKIMTIFLLLLLSTNILWSVSTTDNLQLSAYKKLTTPTGTEFLRIMATEPDNDILLGTGRDVDLGNGSSMDGSYANAFKLTVESNTNKKVTISVTMEPFKSTTTNDTIGVSAQFGILSHGGAGWSNLSSDGYSTYIDGNNWWSTKYRHKWPESTSSLKNIKREATMTIVLGQLQQYLYNWNSSKYYWGITNSTLYQYPYSLSTMVQIRLYETDYSDALNNHKGETYIMNVTIGCKTN